MAVSFLVEDLIQFTTFNVFEEYLGRFNMHGFYIPLGQSIPFPLCFLFTNLKCPMETERNLRQ